MNNIGSNKEAVLNNRIIIQIKCYFLIITAIIISTEMYSSPLVDWKTKGNDTFHLNLFADGIEIADVEKIYYKQAVNEAKKENWNNVESILRKTYSLYTKPLFIESLYKLGKYENIIDYFKGINDIEKIAIINETIQYYILSSIHLDRYDDLDEILTLLNKYYPDSISDVYKEIVNSLIKSEHYEAVIELTGIFPHNIYSYNEKNYILGLVYHKLGQNSIAKAFFYNIDKDSPYAKPAYNYLSIIHYHDKTDIDLLSLDNLSAEASFNYALNYVRAGKSDEAKSVAMKMDKYKYLIELFVAWQMNHYRTVSSILEKIDDFNPKEFSLTSLIAAQTYYNTGNYREAEQYFKHYIKYENADIKYANYYLGESFKGFYRYNSTAYYWMKNIEENHKTVYDSLAAYSLSLLYTETENYNSAYSYYRYYINKYAMPIDDIHFLLSFLKTLKAKGDFSEYKNNYDNYAQILSDRDRRAASLYIGNRYFGEDKWEQALFYYEQALSVKFDDDLLLKIERLRNVLGEYQDSEEFILSFIETHPQNSNSVKLSIDLTKYYISQRRYSQLITFVNSLLMQPSIAPTVRFNNVQQDSLLYYQAVAFKELQRFETATELFIVLHRNASSEAIKKLVWQRLKLLVTKLQPKYAISYLNELIENHSENRDDYLLLLATVYEEQAFYRDANQIYLLLLEDNPEQIELYHSLAINEIRRKNYLKALEYIKSTKRKHHRVSEDILFLSYLANYSLDRKQDALNNLIVLYYEYPNSAKRFEFVKSIIEIFLETEKDQFAFFFLNDYYRYASQSEKWSLDKYREQLSSIKVRDTLQIDDVGSILQDSLLFKDNKEKE